MFTLFKKVKLMKKSADYQIFSCKCKSIDNHTPSEDEIKKSPFCIYEGEDYCENLPKTITTTKKATYLISKNYINDIEKEIFLILNQLIYATSKQIADYLTICGFDISKENVSKKLSKLKENGFIKQLQFKTDNSTSSFKIYTLGKHGRFYLSNSNVYVRKSLNLPPFKVKKILSATQLSLQIALNREVDFRISDV